MFRPDRKRWGEGAIARISSGVTLDSNGIVLAAKIKAFIFPFEFSDQHFLMESNATSAEILAITPLLFTSGPETREVYCQEGGVIARISADMCFTLITPHALSERFFIFYFSPKFQNTTFGFQYISIQIIKEPVDIRKRISRRIRRVVSIRF